MSVTDRAVLELAETWYDSWHLDSDAASAAHQDLYQAVAARRSEPCEYLPNTLFTDIQAQLDAEAWESAKRGEHLIPVTMVDLHDDGAMVEREYLYLESNEP